MKSQIKLKITTLPKPKIIKKYCDLPFLKLKFSPEGDVSMCCFQERGCLGNIFTQSLEEVWNSVAANNIRQSIRDHQLCPACQCQHCPVYGNTIICRFKNTPNLPSQFEIDLPNTHCNMNPPCIMCERNHGIKPQDDRVEEVCRKIHPYMQFINTLHIQGVAEPFWKGRIFDIIEWLNIAKYRITLTSTTNGTLLNKEYRDKFLQLPRSILTWSLDAGSTETYRKLRRGDYNAVLDNLMCYSRERKYGQELYIHNNINLININEVVDMVRVGAEAKVDMMEFNPTYHTPDICVNETNASLFHQAQANIIQTAKELNVKVKFMRNLGLNY